jgi:leucyl-tRNA synthetase
MAEAVKIDSDAPKSAVAATLEQIQPPESKTLKIENTEKRDTLIAEEKKYQQQWADQGVFNPDAPSLEEEDFDSTTPEQLHKNHPKWFGCFAYPYMNGTLHAGHGFTASKVEFTAGFQRMTGKRVLFPLGYHVTGMPIKACADKLVREIEMFGKDFKRCSADDVIDSSVPEPPAPTQAETKTDVTKFKAHKGKAAAKTVKTKYQFQIMLAQGIPLEEIHRFADPYHWIQFFPPLAKKDLTAFGARIDWRRQFVTTDANPYYDNFVAWQMRKLKDMGKIIFAKRYTIYSPKDGQACMDHDRQSGEGVGVQEYTALKMKVVQWADSAKACADAVPQGASAYFVPATLRPETMYGQTSCFVSPTITYALVKITDTEYYVLSQRAARNMSYQGTFPDWGWNESAVVATFSGKDVIGTKVNAPMSVHKEVYILPMETVKDTKGTAVVTCVPSDSPDDYITSFDLDKKAEYYGIQKEWVKFDDILPIIDTPTYGNLTAKKLVEEMKIQSPKDAAKLAEAKDKAYKEGFYKGKMVYGDFSGKPVEEAKNLVRKQLIDAGDAFPYAEPDGKVISRSGDDCVTALLDQWYMNYGTAANGGDGEWAEKVRSHIEGELNLYYPEAKNQFLRVVDWLSIWACARQYGLGTKVPWDPSVMVESLSDSTIYQAYYSFAHLLHKDMFGKEPGPLGVKPEQLTDDAWDYVFALRARSDVPQSDIPKKTLETMRRHFDYWYPLDMRTSGKDLIQNHLTFNLYVHTAIFPKENWPRSFRVNGHLLLNGEKMSKSTGNFLTIAGAVEKFGADATRIALADAGDEISDANFEETVANSNILKLFELRKWCEELMNEAIYVPDAATYMEKKTSERVKNPDIIQRQSGSERLLFDDLFDNEMNVLVKEAFQHYTATSYKLALKSCFYDFTSARDFYREATKAAGIGMHQDLVAKFISLQALLLTPIAPHWAEYIWLEILKHTSTVQNALWPQVPELNASLTAAREFVRTTQTNITSAEGNAIKKVSKGKAVTFDPKKEKKIIIFSAKEWPAWQKKYIDMLREAETIDIKAISKSIDKSESKKAMPFINALKRRLDNGESRDVVLNRELAFDELATLKAMVPGLKQTVQKCVDVEIVTVSEGAKDLPPQAASAEPGSPSFAFENVEGMAVR